MTGKNREDYDQTEDSGFDLSAPIGDLGKHKEQVSEPSKPSKKVSDSQVHDRRKASDSISRGDWKGFELEEEFEPEVNFGSKGIIEDELDMTPMVDVTFLLLIFFMVTASFTLQKSIQQPPMTTDEPSETVLEQPEDEAQYVEVIIDQFNTYRLTSKDVEEIEAPSDQEMRVRMRAMVSSTGAKKLIITAHGDATNEKVVTAWDAGIDNNLDEIVIRLSEEDF